MPFWLFQCLVIDDWFLLIGDWFLLMVDSYRSFRISCCSTSENKLVSKILCALKSKSFWNASCRIFVLMSKTLRKVFKSHIWKWKISVNIWIRVLQKVRFYLEWCKYFNFFAFIHIGALLSMITILSIFCRLFLIVRK